MKMKTSANGIHGRLLNTRNDGSFVFRVYENDISYKDYELAFDDLTITITDRRSHFVDRDGVLELRDDLRLNVSSEI